MPTIAVLKPGVLTVHEAEGNMVKYFVSSGTVSMNIDGTCQILAEEIAPLDDLDAQVSSYFHFKFNQKLTVYGNQRFLFWIILSFFLDKKAYTIH